MIAFWCVVDSLAHRHEQLGPLLRRQSTGRRSRVEDLGHVGVVEESQGLPLGLETGDDTVGVHAALDETGG
jgi:hypothetical protein